MMRPDLQSIEEELRRAVESHAFDEVARLVPSYCTTAEAHARALPPDHAVLRGLASEVDRFLYWVWLMTSTARSQCAADLDQAATVGRYLHSSPKDSPGLALNP
jgi:hypothetical protein